MQTELRYIAIEGVIGVGKTSLAEALAKKFNGRMVLEEVEENPFLPNFYKDPRRFAFPAQIYFLLSRHKQQSSISQMDLFNTRIVCDYIFAKDRIFAYLNLSEHEVSLYEKIYQVLKKDVPVPGLVIYLQASPETLIERIRKRDRVFERELSYEYLASVADAYNSFFFHYNETSLLIVNTENLDFVNNPKDFEAIYNEIVNFRGRRHIFSKAE